MRSRRAINLRFVIPTERTQTFWDSLRSGKMVTTKCSSCGTVCFPPQADCPRCMAGDPEWVELPRQARLVTFTRVEVVPASFNMEKPYTIAVGLLPGGLKVLAWLEAPPDARLKPGVRLTLEARTSSDGYPYYVFVLVQNSA